MLQVLHHRSRSLRAMLLLALVAMQSLVFAHEIGHLDEPAAPQCSVCAIGHSLDVPVAVSHPPFAVERLIGPPPTGPEFRSTEPARVSQSARGPPRSL